VKGCYWCAADTRRQKWTDGCIYLQ